jgi:predicted nucleotidyltransferase component of viral defense system
MKLYPSSLSEIESWRREAGVRLDEARKRFMQFVVLECIAASEYRDALAFKGGNALRFVFANPRSTIDLDFSASAAFPDDLSKVRDFLTHATHRYAPRYGVRAKCQRVQRDPPGPQHTFPTYEASIGYQFPGDRHFDEFESWNKPLNSVVMVEISINDVVCETKLVRLSESDELAIKTCTLEDIVAEKLRSLLQQVMRNRRRRQDLYDIARFVLQAKFDLDREKISVFLSRKCKARNVHVSKAAFDAEVRRRATFEYELLFDSIDPNSIPPEAAWNAVRSLVEELNIPET